MAKLLHFTEGGSCYFLTSTISGRKPIFKNDKYAQILCNIIYNLRRKEKMSLLGFVIMPEHFHLLTVPAEGVKVGWMMQEIKKGSARLINKDRYSRAQDESDYPMRRVAEIGIWVFPQTPARSGWMNITIVLFEMRSI